MGERRFDATAGRLDGLKIGASIDFGFAAMAPAVRDAFTAVTHVLSDCGAGLSELKTSIGARLLEEVLHGGDVS